ncbi:3-phenylpropionate MFS transporter [Edwardsiella ictaluri]|uniref:3-phenylpropionate MFS transporter n=1 Tax=Edwardsiella ictaluri TaxID=67780 RepID=UPI00378486D0
MLPSAGWLGLSYFTYFFSFGVFLPFWSLWLQEQGISPESIGILLGAGMGARFVGSLFITPAVKRYSQLLVALRLVTLIVLFCGVGFMLGSAWAWLMAVMVGFSLFYGPLVPLTDALAATWQRQIGLDYGKVRPVGSLAFIVGSAATGELVNAFGHQAILYSLLGGLLAMLLGMLLRPTQPPQDGPAHQTAQVTPWSILLRERSVWRFLLCCALLQGVHAGYYAFSTLFWSRAGYSASLVGYLWSLGVVAEVIIFALSNRLFRRWTVSGLLLLSCLCSLLRWVMMGATTALPWLVVMQILHAGTFTVCHLAAMRFISARQGGDVIRLQAVYSALGMGGSVAVMTVLAGVVYQYSPSGMFYLMALLVTPVLFLRPGAR